MSFQDLLALALVAVSAGFLVQKTLWGPLRQATGNGCATGCGKCSSRDAQSNKLGQREPLVNIGLRPDSAKLSKKA